MKQKHVLLVAAFSLILALPVQAVTSGNDREFCPLASTDKTCPNREVRCAKVTNNIQTLTGRYEDNYERHVKVYTNTRDRIRDLVKKLQGKGYNTATLEADLLVLKTKVDKLASDYALYHQKLVATKQFVCGQSQGQFLTSIGAAKDSLVTLRTDTEDIRQFYQTTIRADLNAIKAEAEAKKPTASSGQ